MITMIIRAIFGRKTKVSIRVYKRTDSIITYKQSVKLHNAVTFQIYIVLKHLKMLHHAVTLFCYDMM